MSKDRNKLITLALVGACSFGVWKAGQALLADDETQGTEHAVNQVWIDHIPRDDRDMIKHFVLIDHRDGQFGSVGRSSQWRHSIEVFRWRLQHNTLNLFFPQERQRGEVKVRTWRCEGEAPAPFELCLELTNKSGHSLVLYSRDDWKIEPRDVRDSLDDIAEDAPTLAGVLHSFEDGEAEALAELDLEGAESWQLRDWF
ncbi:hypothetical protein ENSA5_52620 [Enhygromyxa salina]|uniref:Uncharacterized protein n=1 Tax=Enhygromyxa salina TaxID=215803 RepID=A0A2S9XG25_9BACT|nr:hypothetical protein [Enhygromyxa salina]PRP91824.1 hypothetical protein ENSA5_52620 [Enhygromyxa salina]